MDTTIKRGQCINFGNCSKANSKEILEVKVGEDFICPECGGSLVEVKDTPFPWWIMAVAAALLLLGGGGDYGFKAALAKGHSIDDGDGKGSISTDNGKYEGELKDGKASGNGTFRFFKSCLISAKDPQKRMAQTGDYVSGQFYNNQLVQGKWFDKDGNPKGTLIIGQTGNE